MTHQNLPRSLTFSEATPLMNTHQFSGQPSKGQQNKHNNSDSAAKTAQSALFAAGSALRFTKSKRLAATLPQMTLGLLQNGPTQHEVTQ